MSKKQHEISLVKVRVTPGGKVKVTPQNCNQKGEQYFWISDVPKIKVAALGGIPDGVAVITKAGRYIIEKHASQNYYSGELNDVKVHIILKDMGGKVIFWS